METKEIKPGIYKHWKKGDLYEVFGTGVDTETNAESVIYRPLYDCPELENRFHIRTTSMFLGEGSEGIPRFRFVGGEEVKGLIAKIDALSERGLEGCVPNDAPSKDTQYLAKEVLVNVYLEMGVLPFNINSEDGLVITLEYDPHTQTSNPPIQKVLITRDKKIIVIVHTGEGEFRRLSDRMALGPLIEILSPKCNAPKVRSHKNARKCLTTD